ncbi:MAG: hypothetical protein RBU36_17570 [Thermoanaerobaculia bacterium]|nr:hypothetical protein [Thermoanaerobaculia bacterium]
MSVRNSYIDKQKEWKCAVVLAASETPLGATKRDIANELYTRIKTAVKEMVVTSVNDTVAFGGYASYSASVRLKLNMLRDDFIPRIELARLILAQRDSVLGSREPTPEEAAAWAAAETVAREKRIEGQAA